MSSQYYEGIGRRKSATARVRLYPSGNGTFTANSKPLDTYFARSTDVANINKVFQVTNTEGQYDMTIRVSGGGVTGQTGAVTLGIARALLKIDPEKRKILRKYGLLTRDPRAKERKKAGLKRARKAPQYTKR